MGNRFDGRYLTNGATDVFFDVLTLAGSALAESPWEQNLVLYFADGQQCYGRGMVGFDLRELPWTQDCAAEKRFFLRVIDTALSGHGWERLSYEPPYAAEDLSAYRSLLDGHVPQPSTVASLEEPVVGVYRAEDWRQAPEPGYLDLCPEHAVFTGRVGCRLCPEE